MKSQFYTLISLFLVIIGLIVYYFASTNTGETVDAEEDPFDMAETIVLIDRTKSDIVKIDFRNPNASYTLVRADESDTDTDTWVIEQFPEIPLTPYTISAMVTMMFHLAPYEKLTDAPADYAEFGLDSEKNNPAMAVAHYTNGETETIIVGSKTPSGDFYYIRHEGDPAVYLLLAQYGDRFMRGYDDIADKTLHSINLASLFHCVVNEGGRTVLEMHFEDLSGNRDQDTFEAHMETYGETFVSMLRPFPERPVYMTSFVSYLEGFEGYSLGKLITPRADNLSEYGLDEPELTIFFEDITGAILIEIGDYADEEKTNVYVRIDQSDTVYLMKASYVECFRKMDTLKFIERFIIVPLPNIGTVTSITIDAPDRGGTYEFLVNHADDPPDATGAGDIAPTVNGAPTDDEDFRIFYRAVIGLIIEGTDAEFIPGGEPAVTITFTYNTDREDTKDIYYDYNSNFYAVFREDNEGALLVSKQALRIMFEYLENLM